MKESLGLQFVSLCWNAIPSRSWRNRNGAMFEAIRTAVTSGMEFHPEDMRTIGQRFSAHYWMGDGEVVYVLACSARSGANIPAAIALEQYLGRPAVLWAERTKTAERLYVGAEFTWKGHRVTVTSMRGDSMVACTYRQDDRREKREVGQVIHVFDGYRTIEAYHETPDGTIMARVSGKVPYETRTVAKRFTIAYADIAAARKGYDDQRRAFEKEISAAETLDALEPVRARFVAAGSLAYRHFDVEMIQAAFEVARARIRERMTAQELAAFEDQQRAIRKATEAQDLVRWMAGEKVDRYFEAVRLRVVGDWVETSTQQKASVAGVRRALAFITKHRRKGWAANGTTFDLDQYPVWNITAQGVQVGCTLVEWSEIDRIAPLLAAETKNQDSIGAGGLAPASPREDGGARGGAKQLIPSTKNAPRS